MISFKVHWHTVAAPFGYGFLLEELASMYPKIAPQKIGGNRGTFTRKNGQNTHEKPVFMRFFRFFIGRKIIEQIKEVNHGKKQIPVIC